MNKPFALTKRSPAPERTAPEMVEVVSRRRAKAVSYAARSRAMPRDRQQPTADAAVADRRRPQQELCHVAWCLFRYTGRPLGHSWGTRAPVCFQSFRAEVDHRCIFTALVHYSVSPVHTPRLAGCTIYRRSSIHPRSHRPLTRHPTTQKEHPRARRQCDALQGSIV